MYMAHQPSLMIAAIVAYCNLLQPHVPDLRMLPTLEQNWKTNFVTGEPDEPLRHEESIRKPSLVRDTGNWEIHDPG